MKDCNNEVWFPFFVIWKGKKVCYTCRNLVCMPWFNEEFGCALVID
jgi:hypothetical protein